MICGVVGFGLLLFGGLVLLVCSVWVLWVLGYSPKFYGVRECST